MGKLKFIASVLLVWVAIYLSYTLFSIFRDIRQNKLLNYTDTYASSEVEVNPEIKSSTTLKYAFKITANDNYLGSISFRYFRLKDNPGQVVFRIREINQPDWYAENRYDFSFFNNDDNYQFGFPEIVDSKDKQFFIEFEIITPNLSQKINILNLKVAPILTAKYVFPRDTYYKSPGKLMTILVNRSSTVISGIDHLKVALVSFIIASLSCLAIFRQGPSKGTRKGIDKKEIQKNVETFSHWTNKVNPFFAPLGVLIVLTVAFVSGDFKTAERMSGYLWISLFGSACVYIFQALVLNRLAKVGKVINLISSNSVSMIDELMTKKVLIFIGLLIVVISGLSTTYYLGGDDSRLFYLYPREFLANYATKIVSDTGASQLTNSIPPTSLAAFTVFLRGLKTVLPIFNLQAILNTANLVGGFFTFYILMAYLIKPSDKHERIICTLTSCLYVFSIFNFYTLLNSRLIAEYLISLFPLSLYLGIRGVREGKLYLFVLAVLIWSTFNFVSVTFPLSAAALITSLPVLVFATWKYKLRLLGYLLVSGALFAVLNLHWLTYIPYTNLASNAPGSSSPSIASSEFRKQNELGIRTVTEINSSFFPLLNSYHQEIQFDFNWPQLPIYTSWYSKILILGFLLISTVILAGILIDRDKPRAGLYVAAVLNFILAVYFFTVNIGPWGVDVFLWLSGNIPGFVIFRNMYDKFSYGLALQWAIVVAVSLAVVVKTIKSEKIRGYLLFILFLIVVLNAKPFIFGEFEKLPYWTTANSFDGIKRLNSDYQELLAFVKTHEDMGRYLSLPLLTGNSVAVQDEDSPNHYYAGVSPLLLLAGKNDMSGLISFADKKDEVFKWLTKKDYDTFGKLLQQYNVRYVIVSNQTSEDLQGSFMFSDGLFALQTKDFFASLTGSKIKDFGTRYSLYSINPKYKSEKLYITDSPTSFSNKGAKLTYNKRAAHDYDIEVAGLSGQSTIVFLDPFLKEWELRTMSGRQMSANNHHLVFDYANMWEIDPQVIKSDFPATDYSVMPDGSLQLNLRLYFKPYDYFGLVNTISASAYALSLLYIIFSFWRSRRK